MNLLTVSGYYRDGQLELPDPPAGVPKQGRVLITFLDESTGQELDAVRRRRDEARYKAGRELVAMMREGADLGGPPYSKREDLYDRD